MLLTRSPLGLPLSCDKLDPARLACVKHAASVRPEPGSNSPSRSRPSRTLRPAWSKSVREPPSGPLSPPATRHWIKHKRLCCPCFTQCIDLVNAPDPERGRERPHWLLSPLFRFQGATVRVTGMNPRGEPCYLAQHTSPGEGRCPCQLPARLATCACRRATVHSIGWWPECQFTGPRTGAGAPLFANLFGPAGTTYQAGAGDGNRGRTFLTRKANGSGPRPSGPPGGARPRAGRGPVRDRAW